MLTRATVTHYVPWDHPARPRTLVVAICGATIARHESDGQPSCPVCRQLIAADEAEGGPGTLATLDPRR
jgi:hypothetical protein